MSWQPPDDFAIRFADKTAEDRTETELFEMVKKMDSIASEYDFSLSASGGWKGMRTIATGELLLLLKYKLNEMITKDPAVPPPVPTPTGPFTLTFDKTNIDAELTDYPVVIKITSSAGQNSYDLSDIFDTLGANSLKLKVWSELEINDPAEQCRCECGYTCGGAGRCELPIMECIDRHYVKDCDHEFLGPWWQSPDGLVKSATCTKCSTTAISHDVLVGL